MDPEKLKKLIQAYLPDADIMVQSEDNIHFFAEIASSAFKNKSRVAQSQMIYSLLDRYIKNNEIHSLSLKTREK